MICPNTCIRTHRGAEVGVGLSLLTCHINHDPTAFRDAWAATRTFVYLRLRAPTTLYRREDVVAMDVATRYPISPGGILTAMTVSHPSPD